MSSLVFESEIIKSLANKEKCGSDATWTPNQTLIFICILINEEIGHILQNMENIFCSTVFKNHAVQLVLEIFKKIERK